MQLQIQVPSLMCEGCVTTVSQAILEKDEHAKIEADLDNKTMIVTTHLTEDLVRSTINEVGHTMAD